MGLFIIAGLAVCTAAALLEFHMETKRFVVTRYTIRSKKLPKAFCGVKMALISDLHNKVYGEENERLLGAVKREKPDYILIAGDILTAKRGEDFSTSVSFLEKLAKSYPVYYSFGNHESRLKEKKEHYGTMAAEYERAIGKLPLHMLHNQKVEIRRNGDTILIYGLEIGTEYYYRFKPYNMTGNYLNKKLGRANAEQFHLLIAHNPYFFPAYAEWGADLVVSGHNHGGIVQVPFLGGLVDPKLRLFPKYDKGLFQERDAQLVLSGGTGSHSPNFRVLNPPELVIITLEKE